MRLLTPLSTLTLLCLALLAPRLADAQAPTPPAPLWLRDPALSPDGTRIAFRFAGQVWIVSAEGGEASALTPAGSHAAAPQWSPDGQTIAFASDRFGPMNVFAIPATGGNALRLTWSEYDQAPTGFTPDGSSVLFWSPGLGDAVETAPIPNAREDGRQLYSVPVTGGRDTMVLPNAAMEARWDPAGQRLLYTGPSTEQPFRRRQVSSAARQVWVFDAATQRHRRLTDGPHESRSALWAPDGGILYLDEASGSLNLWHRGADGSRPQQITHCTGEPVRSPSISRGGAIAFAWGGDLFLLPSGSDAPARIPIRLVHADYPGEQASRATVFSDFALSIDGRDFAVVARGEIAVASNDGRFVKRLPRSAGEARNPTFSADGRRIAYAAERGARWDLFEASIVDADERAFSQATRIVERRLTAGERDSMDPVYAPDGRHIAYVADRASIRVLDPASGSDVEVLPPGQRYSFTDGSWFLSWSPDSHWLAVPVQPSELIDNVALVPADGSRPAIRVAPAGAGQWDPEWSADGGLLTWRTDPGSLRAVLGDRWSADLQGVFTSRRAREAYERRLMTPVAGDGSLSPGDRTDAAVTATRDHDGRSPVPIDIEGLADRLVTLSQAPAQIVFGTLLPDGVDVLTLEQSENATQDGLVVTGSIRDLRLQRERILFTALPFQRGSPLRLSRDRRHLYFLSRTGSDGSTDGLMEVDLARGTSRLIRISVDTTRDEAEARRAAFEQFWTLTARKFYDPSFAGIDWPAARRRYEAFLPSVADGRDLAELLSEMAGELAASHTGARYSPYVPPQERTASLGLYYDERFAGPGMKVAAIIPGSPFDADDSALRPGDVIAEIDGDPLPPGGIRHALRGRIRQIVAVTAEHPDGRRFTEKRVTIDLAKEREIADRRWVEHKRNAVLAASCGTLGYVYVRAMDAESYRGAFLDIFGRFGQSDGLVVDIRDNLGGNLHNQLVTLLSGRAYLAYVPPRGGPVQQEPVDRWTKPSVVVMNAESYSDASVFPQVYKDNHLGKLVGDPVAGTGTAVWWAQSQIVPRLVYGVPQLPLRELDGTMLENREIAPDIEVPSDPNAWARGEDPQLDAAVRSLLPKDAHACPAP